MPAVYQDDFADEVLTQLRQVSGVLVWHNPIEGGRDRSGLDAMLRKVAASGILVSTHPDVILKLGTKDVLLAVHDLPFGSDVYRIDGLHQLRSDLTERLKGGPRVLKQVRGHSGIGVWRIEQQGPGVYSMQHAQRGSAIARTDIEAIVEQMRPYFEHDAYMIDQAWQPRMTEGMVRAYLVQDKVAGFGHQAVVALHPGIRGEPGPAPTQRLYSDANDPRFQGLRRDLESSWVRMLSERTGVEADGLPLLWDMDFFLGSSSSRKDADVLCEINVSSVAPFPDSAIEPLVKATKAALSPSPGGLEGTGT